MTHASLHSPRATVDARCCARPARAARLAACLLVVLVVAGCASRRLAPVEERRASAPRAGTPPSVAAPAPPAAAPRPAEAPAAPAPTYTVKRGDTLYQIALDNGLDYRELAAWNNIENVHRIYVGQVLRLAPPGEPSMAGAQPVPPGTPEGVTTAPLRTVPPVGEARPGATVPPGVAAPPGVVAPVPGAPAAVTPPAVAGNLKTSPKAIKEPYSEQALRNLESAAAAPAPTIVPPPGNEAARVPATPEASRSAAAADGDDDDHLDWLWPAKGRVIAGFSETANLKGIDIAGTAGEPVVASAPGRVVYAGSGLRGYGKLIIIKHNKTYLSAYAHNKEILVKEGQQVARGQKIAEMGSSDADQVKLHFEIRRLGKPMDPSRYLPPA